MGGGGGKLSPKRGRQVQIFRKKGFYWKLELLHASSKSRYCSAAYRACFILLICLHVAFQQGWATYLNRGL